MHVDADAFFASVEQRQKPSTASSPVVVCGLGPRGVVATASYEARRFGAGSAMPTVTARRRCPHGVFLAPRMRAYREHSAAIMAVLGGFADVLEQVSIDEAYLVVASYPGSAEQLLITVVDAVWEATENPPDRHGISPPPGRSPAADAPAQTRRTTARDITIGIAVHHPSPLARL